MVWIAGLGGTPAPLELEKPPVPPNHAGEPIFLTAPK